MTHKFYIEMNIDADERLTHDRAENMLLNILCEIPDYLFNSNRLRFVYDGKIGDNYEFELLEGDKGFEIIPPSQVHVDEPSPKEQPKPPKQEPLFDPWGH